MEDNKDEGFLLGLGFLGLIVYFIYNEEKKKKINEAKASTMQQIAPIMQTLNPASQVPVPLPPVTTPNLPNRLRITEDVLFYKNVFDENGNYIGKDLVFVVPKDTIVNTVDDIARYLGYSMTILESYNSNLENSTEEIVGNTPLSRILVISADAYYNKPRELWNPPCANYLVSNLESTEGDWIINYYDCNGDEQELFVDNQPKVVSAVDTTYKPDSIITNYQSTIQKMPN